MRLSSSMAAVVLGAALTGITGLPALASGTADLNCEDFASQADAQANLDADPSDPNGLDRDNDGQACESYDYGSDSDGGGGDAPGTTGGTTTTTAGDRDCADFSSQGEAQAYYDGQAGDPDHLDRDDDGQACEAYPYAGSEQTVSDEDPGDEDGAIGDESSQDGTTEGAAPQMQAPSGGADTGVGGAAEDGDLGLLTTGGALVVLGAGGLTLARRRSAARG